MSTYHPVVEEFMRTLTPPATMPYSEFLRILDAVTNEGADDVEPDEVISIRTTAEWDLRVAVWRPAGEGPWPIILHLHGGGWVSGNHLSHRAFDVRLAAAGYVVVTVDYRRAPKNKFPAAVDDSLWALHWCADNAERLGGDPTKLVVLGDSAGANLAAAAIASDERECATAGVLLFGIYDYASALPIAGRTMGGTSPETQPYVVADDFEALRHDPRLSPLHARTRWPALYLAAGSLDPLLDQTRQFHAKLIDEGVEHSYVEVLGAPHSYIQLPRSPAHEAGMESILSFLAFVCKAEGRPDLESE